MIPQRLIAAPLPSKQVLRQLEVAGRIGHEGALSQPLPTPSLLSPPHEAACKMLVCPGSTTRSRPRSRRNEQQIHVHQYNHCACDPVGAAIVLSNIGTRRAEISNDKRLVSTTFAHLIVNHALAL